jgi:uncharacterized protein (TIGR00255 family)
MTITSMTGFARRSGADTAASWHWDLRSVNGKSLEVRFKLPPGFEALEQQGRAIFSAHFKRGNIQASLVFQDYGSEGGLVIDEAALEQAIILSERLRQRLKGAPANVESLLGLRGIMETGYRELTPEEEKQRERQCLVTLEEGCQQLKLARQSEGAAIAQVLSNSISSVEQLIESAAANPSRTPAALRSKLKEQIGRLIEAQMGLDETRLHQEAALLALRYDIQEELDRLRAHVAAARELLASNDVVGRKFDFLTQEFNREANTLCSKSNDIALTQIGLELKNVIDQLREQVQNIE